MNKAWLTCMLLCGVCVQVNATENNNHADIKELLKPAPLSNMASLPNHVAERIVSTDLVDNVDPSTKVGFFIFTSLTSEQHAKLSEQTLAVINSLDEKTQASIKKQFKLELSKDGTISIEQIVPVLKHLATLPNEFALIQLGDMCKLGQGMPQNRKQAFDYYYQAAALGSSVAMNNLGECYTYGVGCTSNLETAAIWYRRAAELGNVEAQFNLGYVYEYGEGVPLDTKQARYWYEKAAAKQHADSLFFLGQMYLDGDGVPFDESLAKDYFGRACDLGSTDGCDLYQVMLSDN